MQYILLSYLFSLSFKLEEFSAFIFLDLDIFEDDRLVILFA